VQVSFDKLSQNRESNKKSEKFFKEKMGRKLRETKGVLEDRRI